VTGDEKPPCAGSPNRLQAWCVLVSEQDDHVTPGSA
jgi:hypothetical protein